MNRKMWRTLVRVESVDTTTAKLIIPGRSEEIVEVQMNRFFYPSQIEKLAAGVRFYAMVNIEEQDSGQLFMDGVEL